MYALFLIAVLAADVFGLQWGESPRSVTMKQVSLTETETDGPFVHYFTHKLPKNLENVIMYRLTFHKTKGLQKIVALSPRTLNESKIKSEFDRIESILKSKYEVVFTKKEVKPDVPFLQCLELEACGKWIAVFTAPDRDIMIEIISSDEAGVLVSIEAKTYNELEEQRKKLAIEKDGQVL